MIYVFDEEQYDLYTGSEVDDESDKEGDRLVPKDVDKLDATSTLR
jgi:hypothetical protein